MILIVGFSVSAVMSFSTVSLDSAELLGLRGTSWLPSSPVAAAFSKQVRTALIDLGFFVLVKENLP